MLLDMIHQMLKCGVLLCDRVVSKLTFHVTLVSSNVFGLVCVAQGMR